jgi:hypothetical protein
MTKEILHLSDAHVDRHGYHCGRGACVVEPDRLLRLLRRLAVSDGRPALQQTRWV